MGEGKPFAERQGEGLITITIKHSSIFHNSTFYATITIP
jgi:hypothetical protein